MQNSAQAGATFDYEQWRRDHPRPAAKPLADLDVGEPRTVRMIYFLPSDWPYRADVVDSMKTAIRRVQTFYGEQMQVHGYGNGTFRIETDAQGEPLVHRVDSQHPYSHYVSSTSTEGSIIEELERTFDLDANIYFIILGTDVRQWRSGEYDTASAHRGTKNGGYALIASRPFYPNEGGSPWGLVAHELGHAFGLSHDFRDGAYIMSYGGASRFPDAQTWDRISACSAEFLAVHTYFNPAIPIEEGEPPVIELISPTGYPAGSTSVPVRLKVSDSGGLYQLAIPLLRGRKRCHGLAGKNSAVVEINYDGYLYGSVGPGSFTRLTDDPSHGLFAKAVDAEGNLSSVDFTLAAISPYEIATLEGHTGRVLSVSFSPDGTTLASGSGWRRDRDWKPLELDSTVRLWDVASREEIATLEGHLDAVLSVSFSPDSTTLASGSGDRTVRLWDVASREEIATLEGHLGAVTSVAFSPNGALLASAGGWGDPTVRLWNVASREEIATLEGHLGAVTSVAFSPNGALLASGSRDSTVKLWDVASREEIATLEGHTAEVTSVAFSPNGALLASAGGWDDYTIRLWDVASREEITTLEGQKTRGHFGIVFAWRDPSRRRAKRMG